MSEPKTLLECLIEQIDLPRVMRGTLNVYRIRRKGRDTSYGINCKGRIIAEIVVERPYNVVEVKAIEGLRAGASAPERQIIFEANNIITERLKNQKRKKL